ncbi:hypothetical protein [Gordonia humi]
MAAAIDGRSLMEVRQWISTMDVAQPYQILAAHYPEWASDLRNLMDGADARLGDTVSHAA